MLKPEDEEFESRLLGMDPTGCIHCREGGKMVLLVTGLCTCGCYYCPLSEKKMGNDVVYANELQVTKGSHHGSEKDEASRDQSIAENSEEIDEMIVDEALSISATGTGITGGDPMLVLDRTLHFIRLLKHRFGAGHHIHLYTASIPTRKQLEILKEAGLDEIRFHLVDVLDLYTPRESLDDGSDLDDFITGYLDAIRESLMVGLSAGVEIPVIPDQIELLDWVTRKLETAGCEFLNLNELEFSPTNAEALVRRGFTVRDELSSAALGSKETAYDLLDRVARRGSSMAVHFCSSRYKDAGQLRRRLHRRALNVAMPHELITDDDTFLIGVLEPAWDLELFAEELMKTFEIPEDLVHVNKGKNRVEIAPWVLQEIADDILVPSFIIEEYPTSDRLEVERENLHKQARSDNEG